MFYLYVVYNGCDKSYVMGWWYEMKSMSEALWLGKLSPWSDSEREREDAFRKDFSMGMQLSAEAFLRE